MISLGWFQQKQISSVCKYYNLIKLNYYSSECSVVHMLFRHYILLLEWI